MRFATIVFVALAFAGVANAQPSELMPPGRTLAATGEIFPRTSLFGDTLTARVVATVDRRSIDPDDLELRARFAPFEPVGPVKIDRRDVGSQTQIVYTVPIRCDEFLCIPREGRTPFVIPPARLGNLTIRWNRIEVGSRINQSELQAFRYRATVAPAPALEPRVSPRAFGAASLSAAALLALFAFGLLARVARRTWRRRPELDLAPVERALLFLRWTRGGEDRRRALELLAAALDDEGRRDLARASRRLAWSDADPSPEQAEELALQVEEGRRAA